MDTLHIKFDDFFETFLVKPEIEDVSAVNSLERIIDEDLKQIKIVETNKNSLSFFTTNKNQILIKGLGYFTGKKQDRLEDQSLKIFNKNDIIGVEIDNVRPARGFGYCFFSFIFKNKKINSAFILHLNPEKTYKDWDIEINRFIEDYFSKILSFLNLEILERYDRYNA